MEQLSTTLPSPSPTKGTMNNNSEQGGNNKDQVKLIVVCVTCATLVVLIVFGFLWHRLDIEIFLFYKKGTK